MLLCEDMEMRTLDVSPLTRSCIGFDHLLDLLRSSRASDNPSYPPHNVERMGEDSYRVTLAVAGFSRDEISIVSEHSTVTISGKQSAKQQGEYLYHGISARPFRIRFDLVGYVKAVRAGMENGLLTIDLVRDVPEAMKSHKIAISDGNNRQQQIED